MKRRSKKGMRLLFAIFGGILICCAAWGAGREEPRHLQGIPAKPSSPWAHLDDDTVLHWDNGTPTYYFSFPDWDGDSFFNVRFQAPDTCQLLGAWFMLYEEGSYGTPDFVPLIWNTGPDNFPDEVLGGDTIAWDDIDTFWPNWFFVDLSHLYICFSANQWFHIGFTGVLHQPIDIIAIISDNGNPSTPYSAFMWQGEWYTIQSMYGTGYNLFIRAVCRIFSEEEPAGTVILQSQNPPGTWNYEVIHNSGTIVEWRYEGATITGAWIDGAAADSNWIVTLQTTNEVVFHCGVPLIGGMLEGFHIQGTDAGTGNWFCGNDSGNVAGPLPVELTIFQAIAGAGQVTLRWQTASELDNDHFVLNKRKAGEEDFRVLAEIPGHGTTTEPHDYEFVDRFVQNNITYEYRISDVDITGRETIHEQIVSATPTRDAVPLDFALYPNYPNPFNPTTTIRYDVKETGLVSLKVFDLLGREVATLVHDIVPAGSYSINWDAGELPSGLYLCRMEAGRFVETRKMVLLK